MAALLAGLLAGCVTHGIASWEKPGASAAEIARDRAECQYEATKSTPYMGSGAAAGWSEGAHNVKLQEMCLKLRGFKEPQ